MLDNGWLLFWHVLACRCFRLSRHSHFHKHGVYFPRKSKNRILANYIYEWYLYLTHVLHPINKSFVRVSAYSHTNELRRVYMKRLLTCIDCQRSEMGWNSSSCFVYCHCSAFIILTSLSCEANVAHNDSINITVIAFTNIYHGNLRYYTPLP